MAQQMSTQSFMSIEANMCVPGHFFGRTATLVLGWIADRVWGEEVARGTEAEKSSRYQWIRKAETASLRTDFSTPSGWKNDSNWARSACETHPFSPPLQHASIFHLLAEFFYRVDFLEGPDLIRVLGRCGGLWI